MNLYYANDPTGEWTVAASNCRGLPCHGLFALEIDFKTARGEFGGTSSSGIRSAGRVFVHNGKLHRVTQRTVNGIYGVAADLYRITRMSENATLTQRLEPSFRRSIRAARNIGHWNSARFHHIDIQSVIRPDLQPLHVIALDGYLQRPSQRII